MLGGWLGGLLPIFFESFHELASVHCTSTLTIRTCSPASSNAAFLIRTFWRSYHNHPCLAAIFWIPWTLVGKGPLASHQTRRLPLASKRWLLGGHNRAPPLCRCQISRIYRTNGLVTLLICIFGCLSSPRIAFILWFSVLIISFFSYFRRGS